MAPLDSEEKKRKESQFVNKSPLEQNIDSLY